MLKDPNEVGALWFKEAHGKTYMTGTIHGEEVVIFQNTFKTPGSKQPDWRVLKSRPKGEAKAAESDVPF